ncbi:TPA: hypothetical protein NID96_002050, partial [Pseudomonas aeruginosa]|nr:hypothetical protein [Pseudomonas aeruginosa]HCF5671803.1 hypothetical protein [Pseudomonas aeruginosa]
CVERHLALMLEAGVSQDGGQSLVKLYLAAVSVVVPAQQGRQAGQVHVVLGAHGVTLGTHGSST